MTAFLPFGLAILSGDSIFIQIYDVIANNPQDFLKALSQHVFFLVLIPVMLAIMIAVPLGILATRKPFLERIFLGFVNILQTIPS